MTVAIVGIDVTAAIDVTAMIDLIEVIVVTVVIEKSPSLKMMYYVRSVACSIFSKIMHLFAQVAT